MLFKKIIAVYSENHQNPQIRNTGLQIVETDATYNYH
jgi:hypothetical protein